MTNRMHPLNIMDRGHWCDYLITVLYPLCSLPITPLNLLSGSGCLLPQSPWKWRISDSHIATLFAGTTRRTRVARP